MPDYIISSDLGTGGCRTVLFDLALSARAAASADYPTRVPRSGWAEQDPMDWWRAFCVTTRSALEEGGIRPADVAVVGLDSMSSCALPVDAAGEPLAPAPIWLDRRAEAQARCVERDAGSLLLTRSGNRSDASNFGPKVMWFRDHRPEIYAQATAFLHAGGFLVRRLTGALSTDASECGMSQLCDTRHARWDGELAAACGIDLRLLPPIFGCHDVVGRVTDRAARETGLAEGTPVVAGSMDNVAATLGAGIASAGRCCISAGTATNTNLCTDRPPLDGSTLAYQHLVPGLWISAGAVDYGGAGLKWFRDLLGHEDFREIDRTVAETAPGAEPLVFLPYMVGQRSPLWNGETRGVLFGLGPETSRTAVFRALMEGNALGTRRVLELLRATGVPTLRMTGGCARSETWTRIFADVCGVPVEVVGTADVAPLGAAVGAALGVGLVDDCQAAVDPVVAVSRRVEPSEGSREHYDRLYRLFVDLDAAVQDGYRRLAALQPGRERE